MRFALSQRLRRLESASGGACPNCSGQAAVLLRDEQEAPTCEVCQQPLPAVRLIRDPNFYGNRRRLDEVNHAAVESPD
jgi:hypothetical protein